jgi:hypothetical protein
VVAAGTRKVSAEKSETPPRNGRLARPPVPAARIAGKMRRAFFRQDAKGVGGASALRNLRIAPAGGERPPAQ